MKINSNWDVAIKNEIDFLINDTKNEHIERSDQEKSKLVSRVNWILEQLFKNKYGSFVIPWDFIDSDIGKHLLMIKYKYGGVTKLNLTNKQQLFSTTEVAIMRNVSRQAIDSAIRNDKLRATTSGNNLIIRRTDLIIHLMAKYKISTTDAESIINMYEKMNNGNVNDESRMKELISHHVQEIRNK